MSYNSKYTGGQVEQLLDRVANGDTGSGGITVETDPVFMGSPAASITEAKKTEWDNKVDQVSGKQLSTEDFTTALKTKLEGLSNYGDTEKERQRMIAGNSPHLIWEDIYGKIHFDTGELKSRRAQSDSVFKTTCRKLISCSFDTGSGEWAFLFGTQDNKGTIEEVYPYVFSPAKLTSLNFAFSGAPNIKDWSFLKYLDTSKVTTMSGVFYASTADTIDVSNWDVSNVTAFGTNTSYPFWGSIRKVVGLEHWDTSKVQKMPIFLSGNIEDYSGVKNWDVQNCSDFSRILYGLITTEVDLSLWKIQDGANMSDFIRNSNSLLSFGMPNVPTGAVTSNFGRYMSGLQNIYMRQDALIFTSLNFNESSKLTAESVKVILSHLASTPDSGATLTFNADLYKGFTAEDKVEIDLLRETAVGNGWTIVNMA